jgi:predicted membrane protein
MEDERTPSNAALVENDGLSNSPYLNAATFEPSAEELKELKLSQQKWNLVVFSIGSAAFFFAFLSIIWETAFVTVVAFVFPLVLGPYMIRQRRQLNRIPTLRRLINRTRFQVNRLQVQNNKFGAENTRLEGETDRLKSIQFQLHQVCQTQGTNIDELQGLIREHGTIMKEMNVRVLLLLSCLCVRSVYAHAVGANRIISHTPPVLVENPRCR